MGGDGVVGNSRYTLLILALMFAGISSTLALRPTPSYATSPVCKAPLSKLKAASASLRKKLRVVTQRLHSARCTARSRRSVCR